MIDEDLAIDELKLQLAKYGPVDDVELFTT